MVENIFCKNLIKGLKDMELNFSVFYAFLFSTIFINFNEYGFINSNKIYLGINQGRKHNYIARIRNIRYSLN